ncbi:aldose epimerase family protein [Jannaschia ovalis]|uniref:Galactose mutarotase n=1 Tax=Jannaschia ovalis TaxID=3038773 RepID=A0ABY8LAF7_9RHOB|nr:hypothetical protein [Jannaschia sp. GRR-S6-38]WGH78274.1 hypothetical protein P8627_14775 [Jannaschia sp. GRR-S6-38]
MIRLSARGAHAVFEPGSGHLPELTIDGASVLWAAPWRDDPAVQSDAAIPWVDRRLGGSFVCAPFGRDDADGGPPHGLAANAPWRVTRAGPSALTARRRLSRGRVEARLALRDGHPALYQTHLLELDAPCSFAHHPVIHLSGGGRIRCSPKRAALTFDADEGAAFPRAARTEDYRFDGRDLRDYPAAPCEDFVALVEAAPGLAWTALERVAEADTILILKRAEQLPLTCLWISNGARQVAPWLGQTGILGIEDAACAGADGFAAALSGDTRLAAEGVPLVLPPGRHLIPHAILRLAGRHEITSVTPGDGVLHLATTAGAREVPFAPEHFA